VLVLGIGSEALGLDPITYPQSPSDRPKNQQPLNLFSVWDPSLSTGEFVTGLDISVPPARNGLEPVFSITYRSNRRGTLLGKGWALDVPVIRRSTRNGVPKYLGPGDGTGEDLFEFDLGSDSGDPRFVTQESGKYLYQARREGVFAKFYWEPSSGTWTVLDRSGRLWELTQKDSNPANPSEVFAWYVTEISDVYDNYVLYQYDVSDGVVRLETITYDRSHQHPLSGTPQVLFTWLLNSATQRITYEKGYRSELDRNYLSQIRVKAYNEVRTVMQERTYDLTYAMVPEGQSVLSGIHPEAQPVTSFEYHAPPQNLTKSDSFTISDWSLETASLEYVNKYKPFGPTLGTTYSTRSTLVDVDGDGDLDLLMALEGTSQWEWKWRANTGSGFASTPQTLQMPSSGAYSIDALRSEYHTGPTYRSQDVLHVNNDGKIDFVFFDSGTGDIKVCYGDGGTGFTSCLHTVPASVVGNYKVGYTEETLLLARDLRPRGLHRYQWRRAP